MLLIFPLAFHQVFTWKTHTKANNAASCNCCCSNCCCFCLFLLLFMHPFCCCCWCPSAASKVGKQSIKTHQGTHSSKTRKQSVINVMCIPCKRVATRRGVCETKSKRKVSFFSQVGFYRVSASTYNTAHFPVILICLVFLLLLLLSILFAFYVAYFKALPWGCFCCCCLLFVLLLCCSDVAVSRLRRKSTSMLDTFDVQLTDACDAAASVSASVQLPLLHCQSSRFLFMLHASFSPKIYCNLTPPNAA